jgi:hypothetical protein
MFKKRVYVIKDLESGLYVSKRNPRRLVEFGTDMAMFSQMSQAMRLIEVKLGHNIDTTSLQNDLAWDLLEKVYGVDRWHIDCSSQELHDALDQFKNLKAIPVWLEEVS